MVVEHPVDLLADERPCQGRGVDRGDSLGWVLPGDVAAGVVVGDGDEPVSVRDLLQAAQCQGPQGHVAHGGPLDGFEPVPNLEHQPGVDGGGFRLVGFAVGVLLRSDSVVVGEPQPGVTASLVATPVPTRRPLPNRRPRPVPAKDDDMAALGRVNVRIEVPQLAQCRVVGVGQYRLTTAAL